MLFVSFYPAAKFTIGGFSAPEVASKNLYLSGRKPNIDANIAPGNVLVAV
jgi:hypothetical protein